MMSDRSRRYIRFLKMDAFGAFVDKTVGPLSSGMNVLFGKNEAGKSTVAAFIDGVLFGWRDARGKTNTYKPENVERSGSLHFATEDNPEKLFAVKRVRNADGLQDDFRLVDDIDAETYRSVFSLTSDTLLSLKNTSDITAKLLTAGSGTEVSPALALAEVQKRLAGYVSTAASNPHSLVQLNARKEQLYLQLTEAADESERLRKQAQEYASLETEQHDINGRLSVINRSIENLTTCIAESKSADSEIRALDAETKRIVAEKEETQVELDREAARIGGRLAALNDSEERNFRDRLERMEAKLDRHERSLDIARENLHASKAFYEVLAERDVSDDRLAQERRRNHFAQILLAVLVPIVMVISGVSLFVLGQRSQSLSTMVIGCVLIASSLFISVGSLILLLRPQRKAETQEDRREDARWIMRQDEKKYEAGRSEYEAVEEEIRVELDAMGLSQADGSLRRAYALLDEAKDVRGRIAIHRQHIQADDARLMELKRRRADLVEQRIRSYERAGVSQDTDLAGLEAELDSRMLNRDELMDVLQSLHARHGELKQILNGGTRDTRFALLKLEYEEVQTRIRESTKEYMSLLLAERMLQKTIDSWEALTQPEVYKNAGAMLSMMTDGRWTGIHLNHDGEMYIDDGGLSVRAAQQLSLGTCQQLFLALRIALLMTADNVGRAIPIVADDILVNFDARRRVGAAHALLALSQVRQVILLTCHEEVVEALKEAAAEQDAPLHVTPL